jgi:hypothetical protein
MRQHVPILSMLLVSSVVVFPEFQVDSDNWVLLEHPLEFSMPEKTFAEFDLEVAFSLDCVVH